MAKKVFNMQGGLHSAAAYTAFENRAWGSCVADAASFVVTPGAGMNLNISSGDGIIKADNFLGRRIQVTATETAAVPAANASFNRLDSVVAYIDTSVAPTLVVLDNINDILKFAVVAGTAAGTPVAPTGAAIQAAIGAGNPYMVLYDVLVPQGATNVAGVTLTDRRKVITVIDASQIPNNTITNAMVAPGLSTSKLYNPFKLQSWYNGSVAITNQALRVPLNTKIQDTGNNLNVANGLITCTVPGTYFFTGQTYLGSAGAGTNEAGTAKIYKNGVEVKSSMKDNGSGNADKLIIPAVSGMLTLAVNDTVELVAVMQGSRNIQGGQASTFFDAFLVSGT